MATTRKCFLDGSTRSIYGPVLYDDGRKHFTCYSCHEYAQRDSQDRIVAKQCKSGKYYCYEVRHEDNDRIIADCIIVQLTEAEHTAFLDVLTLVMGFYPVPTCILEMESDYPNLVVGHDCFDTNSWRSLGIKYGVYNSVNAAMYDYGFSVGIEAYNEHGDKIREHISVWSSDAAQDTELEMNREERIVFISGYIDGFDTRMSYVDAMQTVQAVQEYELPGSDDASNFAHETPFDFLQTGFTLTPHAVFTWAGPAKRWVLNSLAGLIFACFIAYAVFALYGAMAGNDAHAQTTTASSQCIAHKYAHKPGYYVRGYGSTTPYASPPSGCKVANGPSDASIVTTPSSTPTSTTTPSKTHHRTNKHHASPHHASKHHTPAQQPATSNTSCTFEIDTNGRHVRTCRGVTIVVKIDVSSKHDDD